MKKHRLYAVLAAMSVALAVVLAGCQQPSSGSGAASGSSETGDSGNTGGGGSVAVDWSKAKVGDIVLTDGTFVSLDNFTTGMTAAAVIVRAKSGNTPALGVGIHRSSTTLQWCKASADGYGNIEALLPSNCTDGSVGWSILKDALGANDDTEETPTKYPAWNFCNTYGKENNLTGDLSTGWYLPTLAELSTIQKNKDTIDTSLEKAGGDKFGSCSYWSCCQSSSLADDAYLLDFVNGNTYYTTKDYTIYVCSVRAFN